MPFQLLSIIKIDNLLFDKSTSHPVSPYPNQVHNENHITYPLITYGLVNQAGLHRERRYDFTVYPDAVL